MKGIARPYVEVGNSVYIWKEEAVSDLGLESVFFRIRQSSEVFYMISDVDIPLQVCYSQEDTVIAEESMCQSVNSKSIALPRELPGDRVLRMFEIPGVYLMIDDGWKPFLYVDGGGEKGRIFHAGVKTRRDLYIERNFGLPGSFLNV
jgi:hypothetical protein